MSLILELPYPPSDNALSNNKRMISKKTGAYYAGRSQTPEYKQFKADCHRMVRIQRGPGAKPIVNNVAVTIDIYAPDNRRRDLFNVLKALGDGLTYSGVWHDDSQIKGANGIWWREPIPHGKIVIKIEEIDTLFTSI